MRGGIVEDEEPASALAKLGATSPSTSPTPRSGAGSSRASPTCSASRSGVAGDQEDLFAAWRVFFERLAEVDPVVLVFEDMQWADAGLLDFVEYLLDWSRNHPIFVLTLARPELAERQPTWGAGKRNFTVAVPRAAAARGDGRAARRARARACRTSCAARILERAEGVPLYAVETVRMLLDRGLLVQEGTSSGRPGRSRRSRCRRHCTRSIAARLDGLTPEERRVVQDAAVLGKTFTKQALAALTGLAEDELEPLLASLVRKEVLSIQADPRSPERGQYGFLQDLVKHVAYETLSKQERKAQHLAAAELPRAPLGPTRTRSSRSSRRTTSTRTTPPRTPTTPTEIRATARELLVARRRARSLARRGRRGAARTSSRRPELTDDPLGAGGAARAGRADGRASGGRGRGGGAHYEQAIELFEAAGDTHPAARVSARLGRDRCGTGPPRGGARARWSGPSRCSRDEEPDEDLATLAAQLGRFLFFAGDVSSRPSGSRWRWTSPRRSAARRCSSQALNTKG